MSQPRFVNIDRETPLLLPPDLRSWVSADDIVHLLLEVVEGMNLSSARINPRGSGSAQYPPGMMLALLIYCYAHGIFSSRAIEQATYRQVAVRFLTGDEHPDHDTICTFRRQNEKLIRAAFAEVLKLSGAVGVRQVGTVCIDGTKILASAAKARTRTEAELAEAEKKEAAALEQAQRQQIDGLLEQARVADAQGADEGSTLPAELAVPGQLRSRVAEARARLRAQALERATAREQERATIAQEGFGELPRRLSPEPKPTATINLTDPESRLMPTRSGQFIQGYNAQLAVSAQPGGGFILAAQVCTETNDKGQLQPMVEALPREVLAAQVEVPVDLGYDHAVQIHRVEQSGQMQVFRPVTRQTRTAQPGTRKSAHRRATESFRQVLDERARSERGRALKKLRSATVEPVFGIIKSVLGWRGTRLRGLAKVNLEWQLVALAFNCRRLHVRRRARAAAEQAQRP